MFFLVLLKNTLSSFFIHGFRYYLNEAYKFANGVKNDYIKRDSTLKAKGTRLDSMGNVKIEDYKKIKDSLETKKK